MTGNIEELKGQINTANSVMEQLSNDVPSYGHHGEHAGPVVTAAVHEKVISDVISNFLNR